MCNFLKLVSIVVVIGFNLVAFMYDKLTCWSLWLKCNLYFRIKLVCFTLCQPAGSGMVNVKKLVWKYHFRDGQHWQGNWPEGIMLGSSLVASWLNSFGLLIVFIGCLADGWCYVATRAVWLDHMVMGWPLWFILATVMSAAQRHLRCWPMPLHLWHWSTEGFSPTTMLQLPAKARRLQLLAMWEPWCSGKWVYCRTTTPQCPSCCLRSCHRWWGTSDSTHWAAKGDWPQKIQTRTQTLQLPHSHLGQCHSSSQSLVQQPGVAMTPLKILYASSLDIKCYDLVFFVNYHKF